MSGEFRELRHVRERGERGAVSAREREKERETRLRDCEVSPWRSGEARRGNAAGRARFRDSLEDISHFRAAPEA